MLNFRLDCSEQFIVCTYSSNKIAVYSTSTSQNIMIVDNQDLNCSKTFIDEACCYISMLDESRKKANIYAFEWTFDVEKPQAPPKTAQNNQAKNQHIVEDISDSGSPNDSKKTASFDKSPAKLARQVSSIGKKFDYMNKTAITKRQLSILKRVSSGNNSRILDARKLMNDLKELKDEESKHDKEKRKRKSKAEKEKELKKEKKSRVCAIF